MKQLFTCIFALIFSADLFGQFSIGAAVGGNVTFWKEEVVVSESIRSPLGYDPLLSYQVMLPFSYSIAEYWQVRAELGYHRRGLRSGNDQSQTVPVRLVYQYLEGGLLTTYSPLRKARAVYFLGGLSMSRLMPLAHIYLKDIPQPSTLHEHFTQDNDFEVRNRTQWLLNLGVGVSKSLGKGKAFVECRMQQSISDTYKTDAIRGGVAVLAMNVGYQYNL